MTETFLIIAVAVLAVGLVAVIAIFTTAVKAGYRQGFRAGIDHAVLNKVRGEVRAIDNPLSR